MVKEALSEAEGRMKGATKTLEESLATLRTGRASPALIEKLEVEYYGTPTPLMQLATISAPEPRLLTIKPFDPGSLKNIELGDYVGLATVQIYCPGVDGLEYAARIDRSEKCPALLY